MIRAMDSSEISLPAGSGGADRPSRETGAGAVSMTELGIRESHDYSLVIDARSPREYADDHLPGAVNLPVVDDDQYAEVGTRHKSDKHVAYLIGVEYSLRNIADQIKPLISRYSNADRFLVYCFRGGKRSRLWADNLRTIGFEVDVLAGGWKRYRQWARESLVALPPTLTYRVRAGPTGCGKTRLLHALRRKGHQVIDLEEIAAHRGSLLGDLPGVAQPPQKWFDSLPVRGHASVASHPPRGADERTGAPLARRLPALCGGPGWHGVEAGTVEAPGRRQHLGGMGSPGRDRSRRRTVRECDGEALRHLLRALDPTELRGRHRRLEF